MSKDNVRQLEIWALYSSHCTVINQKVTGNWQCQNVRQWGINASYSSPL